MHRLVLASLLLIGAAASGCGDSEPLYYLGPNADYPGYRVSAGASTVIPANELGFAVTANGQGGYFIVWTDTLGGPSEFSGTITTDSAFDPTQTVVSSDAVAVSQTAENQIAFASVPGSDVDSISLVPQTDPIYLDAQIDGSHVGVNIFFTGAVTGRVVVSSYDPVAFTSP